MHEGMVSVRAEEELAIKEHVPLNIRDLEVLNEAFRPEDVVFLRNVAMFVANARRQGLKVGYKDQTLLCVRFDVEGHPDKLQSALEEARDRDLGTDRIRRLGEEVSYFSVDT